MLQHRIQDILITQETIDAGALATGQPMPGQIEGQYCQSPLQRPTDQMAIQAHMIIVPVQDNQGAVRLGRAPDLHGHGKFIDLNTTEMLGRMIAEIDPVIAGVAACGVIQGPPRFQQGKLLDQQIQKSLIHSQPRWVKERWRGFTAPPTQRDRIPRL